MKTTEYYLILSVLTREVVAFSHTERDYLDGAGYGMNWDTGDGLGYESVFGVFSGSGVQDYGWMNNLRGDGRGDGGLV
jgi:hypothetical protein